MKELKYRAHNPNLYNRWIYGSSLYKRTIIEKNQYTLSDFWKMIEQGSFKYNGEYTGLHDKNGKEIYEGDIVKQMDIDWDKTSSDTEPVNYVMKETMRDVVTMDRFPCYWLKNEHFGYEGEDLIANEDCEIIGNIYENPELLKGGEKCST